MTTGVRSAGVGNHRAPVGREDVLGRGNLCRGEDLDLGDQIVRGQVGLEVVGDLAGVDQ